MANSSSEDDSSEDESNNTDDTDELTQHQGTTDKVKHSMKQPMDKDDAKGDTNDELRLDERGSQGKCGFYHSLLPPHLG